MWSERKKRFLQAYAVEPTIAGAARRAGVARCTAYRWKADPAFEQALARAWRIWEHEHLRQLAVQRQRQAEARQQRELARRPQRLAVLEQARAARRAKRG